METFPDFLPLPSQDLSVGTGANSIRTKMDGGNIRQRRRFSTEIVQVRLTWEFDDEQMGVFIAWHKFKINLGSDQFILNIPLGGLVVQPHVVRFTNGEYSQEYSAVMNWNVSATFDVVVRAQLTEEALDTYFAEVDPLEGIGTLRLQTCLGYGPTAHAPLGLYKDVACTIPATLAGDSIAAWKDVITGSNKIVSQTDPVWRPTLQFAANGIPVVRFVGFQQKLQDDGTFDFTAPYHLGVTARSNGSPFGARAVAAILDWSVFIGIGSGNNVATFVGNGTFWNDTANNTPATLWTTGRAVSMSNSGTVLQPYVDGVAQTAKVGIGNTNSANIGIIVGAYYAGSVWNGDISAVIFGPTADQAAIDAFLITLIPT